MGVFTVPNSPSGGGAVLGGHADFVRQCRTLGAAAAAAKMTMARSGRSGGVVLAGLADVQ